jgi:nicotinate-nucleotide adenylyltransferase
MDTKELQKAVDEVFTEAFGPDTPLVERQRDILGEALEFSRALNYKSLRSELADLLASAIQAANEQGWDIAELLQNVNFPKIRGRMDQYHTQGRKNYIAILGGAFNPITVGHIATASYVLKASRSFDEVWLLPCASHAYNKDMVSAEHRMEMCKIASLADRRIRVWDYEIANQLAGQTIQTVKRLLADPTYENKCNFSWIIGMDNANTAMEEWIDFPILERMLRFVVVPRHGFTRDERVDWYLKPPHMYLGTPDIEIPQTSSTEVRQALANKNFNAARDWLDPAVLQYIRKHELY